MKSIRKSTLQSLGLGSVLDVFKGGKLPVDTAQLVDTVFGPEGDRGALVITGGNGIVGSGKAMQLGARLTSYGVPIVTLDLPDAPDGISQHYPGLKASFGPKVAGEIMSNIIKLNYDGSSLPKGLAHYKPRFVLEAIPEILELKKSHYAMWRKDYPEIEIRSVTSGFPNHELGVGILHPSFPHQINKVWEVIEPSPTPITQLLWSLGLIPVPVGDYWSFILDVLFCGITLTAIKYNEVTNMPYWKIDKLVRRLVGPNPVRAHDAIGPGASFLTWSCLHHLAEKYGELFRPIAELNRRKVSGESWYSSNRPTVGWDLDDDEEFNAIIYGPLFQMTSLMLKENRADLPHMNAMGELCAQFSNGILATIRKQGADKVISTVKAYHKIHPEAAESAWYPEVFNDIGKPEWQQLYVNAEHDGNVGVITISRESLNWDVVDEMTRAIGYLKAEGIKNVIVTGDFHLSTQMVGADTQEFYPALEDEAVGFKVASTWSKMARRLNDEFDVSVGFINGKRCLGGMLELMMHCHYLVAEDGTQLGMPEVTLPVVPGMEGCHWAIRKAAARDIPKLTEMLLTGRFAKAKETVGWLADYSGSTEDALQNVWQIASGGAHGIAKRAVAQGAVSVPTDVPGLEMTGARKAIMDCVQASCSASLSEALDIQAKHSAAFMLNKLCQKGAIGSTAKKMLNV